MPTTTTGKATEFINFSRASNATVVDSDGKVTWAPHNLLTNSESFDAAAWAKSSVTPTANSIAAPNGTTTADTLAASGANGTTLQTFTAEAISYTFGVWLKRKTGTGNIQIAADSGTYTTVTITSDWALYTVTQTPTAGSKTAGIRIVTSADEVYAWGAHLYRSDLGGMQPNTSAYPLYNPTTPKNLLGYTESLTTGWTNSNTTDAIVSEVNPVGLTGAVDVAATAGNGTLLSSLSLLASPYTFSVWLKRKTGSGTVEITVDGTTYVTAAVTGTWTRFSTTLTPTAGTKTPGIRLVTSGDAVYAWGAQLSDSASLDPYVPVYGAAVTSAAYYGPRRDFDPVTLACKGLLVEELRTNLLLQSQVFSSATWTKSLCTIPAAKLIANNGVDFSNAYTYQDVSKSATSASYTCTVVAAAAEYNRMTILVQDTASSANRATVTISLVNGSVVTAAFAIGTFTNAVVSVTAVQGGYSVSLTFTTGTETSLRARIYAADSVATVGDGASGITLIRAQLEAGSFATSYIPTGAATATRSADVASVSTQAFPYSSTEGTVVVSGTSASAAQDAKFLSVTDGTASGQNNSIILGISGALQKTLFNVRASSSEQANFTSTATYTPNSVVKIAGAYKQNDFGGTTNGEAIVTDTTGNVPSVSVMEIGFHRFGSPIQWINGHIRQITYLPRRITNTELQTRTA